MVDGLFLNLSSEGQAPPSPLSPTIDTRTEREQLEAEIGSLIAANPLFAPQFRGVLDVMGTLGEGGMGLVLKVRDRRLGRLAALKVLRGEGHHKDQIERFMREARVTAALDHPSIPPVYDAGTNADGEYCLLMRLIEGETLELRIETYHEAGRPEKELRVLLEALVKVGEAVAHAHSRGIIHRDLKPANVMVGQYGEVLLIDWGVARVLDEAEDVDARLRTSVTEPTPNSAAKVGLTEEGSVVGTAGYMAPEQADGESVDARADVFALGAILTEILTGRLPVSGTTAMNRLVATIKGEIDSPREILGSVPKELDALARAALAVEREDRLGRAESFVAELRAYLAGEALSLYRYGNWERVLRGARRHPTALVGVFASLVLLLAGASFQQQWAEAQRGRGAAERKAGDAENLTKEQQENYERGIRALERLNGILKFCYRPILPPDEEKAMLEGARAQIAEVLADLDAVTKKGDELPALILMKGKAHLKLFQYDDALVCAERAIGIDKKSGPAWLFKGQALIEQLTLDLLRTDISNEKKKAVGQEAAECYKRARSLNVSTGNWGAAWGAFAERDWTRAEGLLAKMEDTTGSEESAEEKCYFRAILTWRKERNNDLFRRQLDEVLKICPRYFSAVFMCGSMKANLGDKSGALKDYNSGSMDGWQRHRNFRGRCVRMRGWASGIESTTFKLVTLAIQGFQALPSRFWLCSGARCRMPLSTIRKTKVDA